MISVRFREVVAGTAAVEAPEQLPPLRHGSLFPRVVIPVDDLP